MADPPCDISAVVPVYKNRDTVSELARRLAAALEKAGLGFEIIFVDDGCPGGSGPVLKQLAEEDGRISVLTLSRNVGQHKAVLVGMTRARGRAVAILDADLQDPPEAVLRLWNELQRSPAAAVFAGRRGQYESRVRLLSSWLYKRSLAAVTSLPRDAGIFVLMARPLVDELLRTKVLLPAIVAMIGCSALPKVSIPVNRAARSTGHSSYSSLGRWRSALAAFTCVLSDRWPRLSERHGFRADQDGPGLIATAISSTGRK